jgi:hypothetical protein
MCPLCWTSFAITVTTTTGIGAVAMVAAARVAKSIARDAELDVDVPEGRSREMRGGR